jgi:hypothetical protein
MPDPSREPTVSAAHRRESVRADRRWLIVWTSLFVAWMALGGIVLLIYRATGPHPEMNAFIRRVKHEVRWLIPFRKIPRNKRYSLRLEPDQRRHAPLDLPGRQIRIAGPYGPGVVEVDLARVRDAVG